MPPPSRNHRVPTAGDTPATTPASSLENPSATACQKRCRCSRRAAGGRPATAAQAFPSLLPPTLLAAPSTHRLIEVLRRPLEFTPYTSAQLARFRPRAQPGPLRWPHRGVGQRSGRIILGHTQSRVLRQIPLADQAAAKPCSRRLDRTSLQPTQTPLDHRYHQPGRLRRQTHSDRTSRLTLCPPNGVKPNTPCAEISSALAACPNMRAVTLPSLRLARRGVEDRLW